MSILPEIPPFQPCEPQPEWRAQFSVVLGQLIEEHYFTWEDGTWDFPKYSDEQDARLKAKILDHFYLREIALLPLGAWKHEFLRKLREIMPKYIPLYRLLDESPQLLGAYSDYYKSRNIYSDFPQTSLDGRNGDYASTGNDMEYERIRQLDILDLAERLKTYDDVDLMIINEMDSLFCSLLTQNYNAY